MFKLKLLFASIGFIFSQTVGIPIYITLFMLLMMFYRNIKKLYENSWLKQLVLLMYFFSIMDKIYLFYLKINMKVLSILLSFIKKEEFIPTNGFETREKMIRFLNDL